MEFDGAGNFHYDSAETIREGWKSLMEMVFSGRGNFLKIRKLVVHPRFENPSESLKLNVQNLVLVPWMDFRAVRDLISENSLPLESVEAYLSCYKRHKIFDTAKILKLTIAPPTPDPEDPANQPSTPEAGDQNADPMEQVDQNVQDLHGPGPATLQMRMRNLPDPMKGENQANDEYYFFS
ncbi:hypothetical protein B9Z55_023172 [Caenorhabditis nigoni]|uniref:Uncharacterized protein n=1 Tax=Caenorhabditis nigoni TaxID=1611254 RepID=A0A2G5SNP6_9PELO|nr:hypothetical protein B9Z55_023172 [Caenorhabditis nigoni]